MIERLAPKDETLKRRRMGLTPSKKTEEEMREEVKKVFGNGEIIGSTRFETNEYGNFASVDFYFYPNGLEKRKETMNLIQRGNNWYLSSF